MINVYINNVFYRSYAPLGSPNRHDGRPPDMVQILTEFRQFLDQNPDQVSRYNCEQGNEILVELR